MNEKSWRQFFAATLPAQVGSEARVEGGYALPEVSVECLRKVVDRLGVRTVFEFGSGRSTLLFLEAGCELTSLEDSEAWLAETAGRVPAEARGRWHPIYASLARVWHRGVPFLSWPLTEELTTRLAAADLVLIDSPALPPSREHALVLALRHAGRALIVVDDANIPTVARYCRRLARRNERPFFQTTMDHGVCFIGPGAVPVDERRSVVDALRAWRFYLIRRRFRR